MRAELLLPFTKIGTHRLAILVLLSLFGCGLVLPLSLALQMRRRCGVCHQQHAHICDALRGASNTHTNIAYMHVKWHYVHAAAVALRVRALPVDGCLTRLYAVKK
jgi:hypothetical protein